MFADLHLHSTFSDGTDTPARLCDLADDHRVRVISITDHDTVGGQRALLDEDAPRDVEVIPGIEISTVSQHRMIHILGYYIDLFDKELARFIGQMSADKTESTRLNFENARAKNIFSYDWARVLELNPGQPRISGVHVVKAMGEDGYEVPGMALWDMFHRCFWPGNDGYIARESCTGYDAVDIIKTAGGIPVIAHPKDIGSDDIVLDLIRYGAQGIEVYHPVHTAADVARYRQMAEDKKLYISGGSDFHGGNNPDRLFAATGLADESYELLKLRTRRG